MTTDTTESQAATAAGRSTPARAARDILLNLLLVAASGVLASLLFPPRELWWVGWFCLAPLFIALRRTAQVRAAGWLMLLFGLVFFASTLSWLYAIFGKGVLGICIIAALPWVLFAPAYRATGGRCPGLPAVLLAPVLWLAVEWIRCEGWYFQFSWGQFGFAFADTAGSALYPYIGVFGVTFLFVLVNAALAEALLARARGPRRAALAVVAAVVIPVAVLFSRPPADPPGAPRGPRAFRALLVQDESSDLEEMERLTREGAATAPQLIVWPEYAILAYPFSDEPVMRRLQALARETGSTLVVGCKEHAPADARVDLLRRRAMLATEGGLVYNSALLLGPGGEVIGAYRKTHPIQFFADGVPGRAFPAFSTPVGRVGVAICYDFDYASTGVALVKNGAEILAVPTYDSEEWTDTQHDQHSRMAQARAAEVGRWVLRATSSGISQIIHPGGRVVASIPNGASASISGLAEPLITVTPYLRGVYLLPNICLALSGLWVAWLIGTALAARRRRATAQSPGAAQ